MSQLASSPSEQIMAAIARLRCLSQVSIQPGWRYCDQDLPPVEAADPNKWNHWAESEVNAKDHHPWMIGQTVRWFARLVKVPADLNGYPLDGMCLRLALLWWATEAQVYVNGELVQEGDLFDCAPRLLLSSKVKAGDEFAIALRLVSPTHEDGALMKSACHYETLNPDHFPEPAFVANEIAVLHSFLEQFQPEKLNILGDAISKIDWASLTSSPSTPSPLHPLTASLQTLRQTLVPLAEPIKQRHITLVGHAHLDMAWLWTVEETWEAAERTFRSVLNLQQEFPELTFAHTTPALYEWMEQNRPDLFAQIQAQVKAGKWEIVAGFWIEPELNLINGESIARQILYGQRYIQDKFGQTCAIAWVPDTFGFTWQLPQLLKQGGVDYFVTQKLRWNDTTKFPHEVFSWQAPDGTQIFSLMSAPIGEAIDPVKMANFAWELEQKTGLQTTLWLPGVGDHGGGPTRDMLEVARRWQRSPFFPTMEFGTVIKYLEEVKTKCTEPEFRTPSFSKTRSSETSTQSLPIWNSELYLEFHRGCYTTHADQKEQNRCAEELLYEAELWASLATIAANVAYPKAKLEDLWKEVLFNQFHDILPGSSVTSVFVEANKTWESVQYDIREILFDAQETLSQHIVLPSLPHPNAKAFVVFNPSNWEQSQVISKAFRALADDVRNWQICDMDGQAISPQNHHRNQESGHYCISFIAQQIPAIGYRAYWLCPCAPAAPMNASQHNELVLENEFLIVTVDPNTGDLASIFDKTHQREILAAPGNQLQVFEDKGQYWDAWNINPDYANHPLPAALLLQIETGQVAFCRIDQQLSAFECRIRVERKIGQSVFDQMYILQQGSPVLKIQTYVDWQERHVLVKAAFSLNLEADFATYEIPCGAIQRTTKPQTEAEKAQWEVPAMRWADLSDGSYGVSLLNDCKYGYDAQPSQLRLTLLRGSEWPDPEADKGWHTFTYAIYPHAGDWKQAQTVRRGYELNMPLQVVELSADQISQAGTLPPVGSLLGLGAENLVLMALKQSEDAPDEWILRCYECHGEEAQLNLSSDLNLRIETAVDLLEQPIGEPIPKGQPIAVRPWEIVSFKLKRDRD